MSKRPANYTTKQGTAVLAFLQSHPDEHITAAQIEARFAECGITIGRTTIYRQLDRLMRDGKIRKYVVDEGAACYQYVRDCSGVHFHLKCKKCGELIHTRGRALLEIAKSICDDYNFEIDASCTVFYGVCGTCADKGST